MSIEWILYAAVAAVAAYFVLVNRKRQTYADRTVIDAPIDAVWEMVDFRPGRRPWIPAITGCVWEDEAARDMRIDYATGQQTRARILAEEPRRYTEQIARFRRSPDAPYGDLLHTRYWLEPDGPDRTKLRLELRVEREQLWDGVGTRLMYPFLGRFGWSFLRADLASRGLLRAAQRPASGVKGHVWRIAAVVATLGWLAWIMGPWAGAAVLGMLVLHEYGHVWSMRRNGHETARFYLVPFFGGVAIGSRAFASDAEGVEIFLMGPVFGLAPSVLSLGLFGLTGDPFFAELAGLLAIVNGLNLAPVPPLDGGRVTQALIRPLGDKTWFVMSGLLVLAGAAVSAYYRLTGLMIVALLGAWAWSATPQPNPMTRPLTRLGVAASLALYLLLIALHAGLFFWSIALDSPGWVLEEGPAFLR